MSERTQMQPVVGLTKSNRPTIANIPPPPPRIATRPEPTPEPESRPRAVEAAVERGTAPAAPRKAAKPSETTGALADVTFTTPLELRTLLREHARVSQDLTVPGIVLAAVEANVTDLARLVELEKGPIPAGSALFPDPTSSSRPSETRVPESMRLSTANLAVVDALVRQTQADNRSQLITAALRAHLKAKP
jgi:hypothetical protein